jgi:hypothetical protein
LIVYFMLAYALAVGALTLMGDRLMKRFYVEYRAARERPDALRRLGIEDEK